MDSKFYVSLEAARLLKEKGYNEETDYSIDEDNCMMDSRYVLNKDLAEYVCSCPTKTEAIDWLESKGIGISIIFCEIEMYEYVVESKDCYYSVVESGYKETRLEAEEAAIIKALELL
jgi:hypothetical protein